MAGRRVAELRLDRVVDADEGGREAIAVDIAQDAVGRVQDGDRIRVDQRGRTDALA